MSTLRAIGAGALAERALALSYAARGDRAALAALFALDDRLGAIVAATTEPLLGQMRLTWWHDALTRLDQAPPPPEPHLAALAATALRRVSGAQLATLVEAWETALAADASVLAEAFAPSRGSRLFTLAEAIVGEAAPAGAGIAWGLADVALRLERGDPAAVAVAARARPQLTSVLAGRWTRATRPLGAMVHLARLDVAGFPAEPRHGAPGRIARLLGHRLTGR